MHSCARLPMCWRTASRSAIRHCKSRQATRMPAGSHPIMSYEPAALSHPITIFIDADACPVKAEVYRVAERFALKGVMIKVLVVSNAPIAVPRDPMIERVVVGAGMDTADDWIAERVRDSDVVITADVPLASRTIKAGPAAIAPYGQPFTTDSIGMALATRNLMADLRSAGAVTTGPKPFGPAERSRFLSTLDRTLVRLVRAGFGGKSS